jgi:hypothetical protein
MGKYDFRITRHVASNIRIPTLLRALRFLARRLHIAPHNHIALHNQRGPA